MANSSPTKNESVYHAQHSWKILFKLCTRKTNLLTLRFSRQFLKWALRFFSNSLWVDLDTETAGSVMLGQTHKISNGQWFYKRVRSTST